MMPPIDPRRWDEIQATFDALVDLTPGERSTRLAALGVTDPVLHAALESLLAVDAAGLPRLAPLDAAFFSPTSPAHDPLNLVGRTVSHFHVLEPLGAGGMGVVYRAEDTRLGRAVALKFLLPHYGLDPSAKERFLREAHSAAALDHPNLCTIHEVGESDDGHLFLAMALYPGETIEARLAREGPLPVGDALAITRQIAAGLACAHAAGIVHRDLKPGNVMLVPNGDLKVLDFGLAKALDQSLSTASARMGTPSYMAPEQVQGGTVDARTDLWALGVVLYEMLTGRNPFDRDHEIAVAHAILVDEPVPPSTLRVEVPASVEDVVLTLLQKDPAKRYFAADQLSAHLVDIGKRHESAVRSVETRSPRARRILSKKRRWTGSVIAAGMGVLGVLVGAALIARARNTEAASRVVVMPFENRTAVTELNPLGPMAAEWVTQRLTELPFLTVLDTRSALAIAGTLGTGTATTPVAMRREAGAGLVVAGSYFLQGDSLQFQAQVSSAIDGSVLLSFGGVTAPRDLPMTGVEQVRQRLAAGLASLLDRDVSTFQTSLRQPPTYAAYREYVEGLELYMGNEWGDAALHFLQAAVLDPSFLTAGIWAAQASALELSNSTDEAWARRADSLLSRLQPLKARLAPYDRARLDFVVAFRAGDLRDEYRAALRLVDAFPGSVDARREAALTALRVLRPHEGLRRMQELDPERGLMREWEAPYWLSVTDAQHSLGQHEDELKAARRIRQHDLSHPEYVYYEMRALAALGRIAELDSLARVELSASGQPGLIAFSIAGELMAHGHAEVAKRFAESVSDDPGVPPSSEPEAAREWLDQHVGMRGLVGAPPCYVGAHLEKHSPAERARDEWVHWRAELALLVGDTATVASLVAQLRNPGAHSLLLARILAARGKVGAAREALARWEGQMVLARGTLNGLEIERASVLVRLGDMERALEVLSQGIGRRALCCDGHAYPDFAPLWNDPRFRALIKPRG